MFQTFARQAVKFISGLLIYHLKYKYIHQTTLPNKLKINLNCMILLNMKLFKKFNECQIQRTIQYCQSDHKYIKIRSNKINPIFFLTKLRYLYFHNCMVRSVFSGYNTSKSDGGDISQIQNKHIYCLFSDSLLKPITMTWNFFGCQVSHGVAPFLARSQFLKL